MIFNKFYKILWNCERNILKESTTSKKNLRHVSHRSLFLVIWYWSSSHFYNIADVNYIFTKLLIFLFQIKKEFNLLKALLDLRNAFLSWHPRFVLNFLYTYHKRASLLEIRWKYCPQAESGRKKRCQIKK